MRSPRDPAEPKALFVVREDLRQTPGKIAAQVAHAAVMLVEEASRRDPKAVAAWRSTGQRKIVVLAPSLPVMQELARSARARGLTTVMVEDAGHTEVAPGTRTVLGIGPGPASVIDPITGHLPLL